MWTGPQFGIWNSEFGIVDEFQILNSSFLLQKSYLTLNCAVRLGPPLRIDRRIRNVAASRRSALVTPAVVFTGLLKLARFVTLKISTYAMIRRFPAPGSLNR